jgi:hypothetical protein
MNRKLAILPGDRPITDIGANLVMQICETFPFTTEKALGKPQETLDPNNILSPGKHVDDRVIDEIRPRYCETYILPRVDGTRHFNR